jgi:hypothetical protein
MSNLSWPSPRACANDTNGGAPPNTSLGIASLKLRLHDHHARIVPSSDATGCPFEGAGVDVRGDEMDRLVSLSGPVFDWLEAREPGVSVRSFSIDVQAGRVLVTLYDAPRPRVVRIDGPMGREIVEAASPLLTLAGEIAARKLRARALAPAAS